MSYLIGLFCFLLVAVFSSQSLVDVADTLIVATTSYMIFKNKDYVLLNIAKKTWFFWITWLLVIFIGLFLNYKAVSENFPWIYLLEYRWFISFFSMIYLLIQIKDKEKLITSLGITALILNIIAFIIYFVRDEPRVGGIYNGTMAFSQNLGMVLCFFVIYLACVYKYDLQFKYKKLLIAIGLTSILLVLLTLTRGVWIASAFGVSVSAYFIPRRVFIYTLITIAGIFGALSYFNSTFNQRIYSKGTDAQVSNSQRKNIWYANFEIFKDYPILGAGYTLNNELLPQYYKKLGIPANELKSHAHNQYLHFAAGTGILGLIIFCLFLFYILRIALIGFVKSTENSAKSIYLSLLSAVICFCLAAMTESNFSISKNRILFLFFCAFILAQKYKIEHKPKI